jgi:hypothetical protein
MAKAVFLINGAGIPYHVVDAAIGWAKENNGDLLGVFVFSDQRRAESYGFPSDIEKAETLVEEEDAESDLHKLVSHNRQYAEKTAAGEGVSIQTVSLKDPDSDTLMTELTKGEVLFLDPQTLKGDDEYASTRFQYEDIVLLAPRVIEVFNI